MLSVTSLSTYAYCKRKLYLQYVLGIKEPPSKVIIKGSLCHKVYEKINKIDKELVINIKKGATLSEIKEKYNKGYIGILTSIIKDYKAKLESLKIEPVDILRYLFPLIVYESEIRAKIVYDFIKKYNIYGEELWLRLTPKIKSEMKIESGVLGLRGVIDQIRIYDERIVPVEIKTGKCPKEGVWPSHKIQLIAYALLLEEELKLKVNEGWVYYIDEKEKRQIPINPFMKLEIVELIKKAKETITSDTIPGFEKNQNKCVACGLKEICYDEKKLDELIEERKNQKQVL